MTDASPKTDELVERLKVAIEKTAHAINDYGQPLLDNPEEVARACLSAIEAEGPTLEMILAGLHTTDMLGVEDIDGEALAAAFKSMIRVAAAPKPK